MGASLHRLSLLALVLVACDGEPPAGTDAGGDGGADAGVATEPAQVRFAHLAWDAPAASVWVDGAEVVDAVATLDVAPSAGYLATTSGPHEVVLAPVGAGPDAALLRATLVFAPNAPQTVFSFGTLAPPDGAPSSAGLSLSDDTPPAARLARGRFVHAAGGTGPVDVWAGTPWAAFAFARRAEAVAPGAASGLLLDGVPTSDTSAELQIGLAPPGADEPTTAARVRERFGPFTLVALVGDPLAPTQYQLVVLTDDRVLRIPLSSQLCVAHTSALPDVGIRVCRVGGGCYGEALARRHTLCLAGGVAIEIHDATTDETLLSVPLRASHFDRSPLVVLHDRDGSPTVASFALAAASTSDFGVRGIHVAEGWGPITLRELGDGPRATATLRFGEATELLPIARADAMIGADVDGATEQRLPLRGDASDAFDVLAFDEGGALRLARLQPGRSEPMLVVGDVPVGGDCADDPCVPEALCVSLPEDSSATCRRADCPTWSCGADETCGVVRTDYAIDPEIGERQTQWPTCVPRVDVDADVDGRLEADSAAGALRLSIAGERHVLDDAHLELAPGLRGPTGVLATFFDPARAAGGAGWAASLRFSGIPATGLAHLDVVWGEGPSANEGASLLSADVDVTVTVAPASLAPDEPFAARMSLMMGAAQVALSPLGSGG